MAHTHPPIVARQVLEQELEQLFGQDSYYLHRGQAVPRFGVGLTKDKQSGKIVLAVLVNLTRDEWSTDKGSLTVNNKPFSEFVKPIPSEFDGYGIEVVPMEPANLHQGPVCNGDVCELP